MSLLSRLWRSVARARSSRRAAPARCAPPAIVSRCCAACARAPPRDVSACLAAIAVCARCRCVDAVRRRDRLDLLRSFASRCADARRVSLAAPLERGLARRSARQLLALTSCERCIDCDRVARAPRSPSSPSPLAAASAGCRDARPRRRPAPCARASSSASVLLPAGWPSRAASARARGSARRPRSPRRAPTRLAQSLRSSRASSADAAVSTSFIRPLSCRLMLGERRRSPARARSDGFRRSALERPSCCACASTDCRSVVDVRFARGTRLRRRSFGGGRRRDRACASCKLRRQLLYLAPSPPPCRSGWPHREHVASFAAAFVRQLPLQLVASRQRAGARRVSVLERASVSSSALARPPHRRPASCPRRDRGLQLPRRSPAPAPRTTPMLARPSSTADASCAKSCAARSASVAACESVLRGLQRCRPPPSTAAAARSACVALSAFDVDRRRLLARVVRRGFGSRCVRERIPDARHRRRSQTRASRNRSASCSICSRCRDELSAQRRSSPPAPRSQRRAPHAAALGQSLAVAACAQACRVRHARAPPRPRRASARRSRRRRCRPSRRASLIRSSSFSLLRLRARRARASRAPCTPSRPIRLLRMSKRGFGSASMNSVAPPCCSMNDAVNASYDRRVILRDRVVEPVFLLGPRHRRPVGGRVVPDLEALLALARLLPAAAVHEVPLCHRPRTRSRRSSSPGLPRSAARRSACPSRCCPYSANVIASKIEDLPAPFSPQMAIRLPPLKSAICSSR